MADDGAEIVELGLPAEPRPRPIGCGDDLRRIAGTAFSNVDTKVDTGDPLHGVDHLEYREAAAIAAVERRGRAAASQMAQRIKVRLHEVAHMDVVAESQVPSDVG